MIKTLFIKVDLSILPSKQFIFLSELLERFDEKDQNLMLKGLISLGFHSLSQKELNMFSDKAVRRIQDEGRTLRFRIYESPEYNLLSTISKRSRRSAVNTLFYSGVSNLQNMAKEFSDESVTESRKNKIEELVFKSGLYKEFEYALNISGVSLTVSKAQKPSKPPVKDINSAKPPAVPTIAKSVAKQLIESKADSHFKQDSENFDLDVDTDTSVKIQSSPEAIEPINIPLTAQPEGTQPEADAVEQITDDVKSNENFENKRNRWKKISIDSG